MPNEELDPDEQLDPNDKPEMFRKSDAQAIQNLRDALVAARQSPDALREQARKMFEVKDPSTRCRFLFFHFHRHHSLRER